MSINLTDIQQELYERLKPSGWADKLKGFILSDDFHKILEQLLKESENGGRFTPPLRNMFRSFIECPYKDLAVVMVTSDPYPQASDADGIAFSCSQAGVIQMPLKFIFEELERTVDPQYVQNPDLKRWSNQGILMLNTSLTTSVGELGSHAELWKPFMVYLFDMLSGYNPGLLYVYFGEKGKEWRTHIAKSNFKFFSTHPISAAYTKDKQWNSGDLFNQINKVLDDHYNIQIVW